MILHLPLISSNTSGFFLWGIILEPVVISSGNDIKFNSWAMKKQMSAENFDKVLANEPIAIAMDFSTFPLFIWEDITLYFNSLNPNSFVVKSLSILNELPYPAALPSGFWSLILKAVFKYNTSSINVSAYEENHKPKDEGIATCRWVYPGSKRCLFFSARSIRVLNKLIVRSLIWCISFFKYSCVATNTWSFLDLPVWIFFPIIPNFLTSIDSIFECTSS